MSALDGHRDRVGLIGALLKEFRCVKIGGTIAPAIPVGIPFMFPELSVNDLQDPKVSRDAPANINLMFGQFLLQSSDVFRDGDLITLGVSHYTHVGFTTDTDKDVYRNATGVGLIDIPSGLFIDMRRRWIDSRSRIFHPMAMRSVTFWRKTSITQTPVPFRETPFKRLHPSYVRETATERQKFYTKSWCTIDADIAD